MGNGMVISLDIGNTLIRLEHAGFCNAFRTKTAVSRDILRPLFFEHFLTKNQPLEDAVFRVCNIIGYDNPQRLIDEFLPAAAFLFDDTIPALEEIKRIGLPMIAISNCTPWEAGGLELLGLNQYLDRVFYSYIVGAAKPDPAIFRHVQESIGVQPQYIIHVGDSWAADIVGAQSAGWRAVFLAREDTSVPSKEVDASVPVIRSLTELPFVLEHIM
jgi:FMN phosphatase YigB (HAD superfamily)